MLVENSPLFRAAVHHAPDGQRWLLILREMLDWDSRTGMEEIEKGPILLHTYMQHHASLSCQVEIYLSAVEDARIEPKVFPHNFMWFESLFRVGACQCTPNHS